MPHQIEDNSTAITATLEKRARPTKGFGVVHINSLELFLEQDFGVFFFVAVSERRTENVCDQHLANALSPQFLFDSLWPVFGFVGSRQSPTPGKRFVIDVVERAEFSQSVFSIGG
jgi:hypothetical protein